MALQERPTNIIKTSHYDSTTETSKSVPAEMILEILLRLPVESLLRCKSVCKLWFSLISDTYFVKSHLKLSTTNNNEYAYHKLAMISNSRLKSCPVNDLLLDKSVMNAVDHAYPLSSRSVIIFGSCNGLLCIFDDDKKTLFICNPSTRMWNQLPSSGIKDLFVAYSFGYDGSTDDYKVVGIPLFSKTGFAAKIFSLKIGKWKNIDCILPDGIQLISYDGKFSNGAIHWKAQDSKSSSDHFAIVSLDLAKETYGQVAPPVYDVNDRTSLTLGVLGEWLCVLCRHFVNHGSHADVWVMKVYGVKDSWTKLVSIPFLTRQPSSLFDHISVPLFISNDGKVMLQLVKKLVVYDSKNKSFSEIHNFGAFPKVFVESLVSPSTTAGLADNNADQN